MKLTKPPRRPSDPNQLAHSVASEATGQGAPVPLPAHVTVKGATATCGRCGKTFDLSKREGERAAELRAFAAIHRHGF